MCLIDTVNDIEPANEKSRNVLGHQYVWYGTMIKGI